MSVYFKGMIHSDTIKNHQTEKAFYVDIDDGRWGSRRNKHMWIPKSICKIGDPNEVGWCEILVPAWFFKKNRVEYQRVLDISWNSIEEV